MNEFPPPEAPSPVPIPTDVSIHHGPALLNGIENGPSLAAHRRQYGELPKVSVEEIMVATERMRMRGRGGAAFPFAVKLRAAADGRRPYVVVNLSEGEPASAKDSALALARPHLILDGAVGVARALKAKELHLVYPGDRPAVARAMEQALSEREDRLTIERHQAEPRFVAGQARAVLELIAGRPNLPVTAWQPEAVSGHRRRPTLLSNAETFAQLGRLILVAEHGYRAHGTAEEPGTTLLTITAGAVPEVLEVPFGTRIRDILPPAAVGRPALIGGFHGAWAPWSLLAQAEVSVDGMKANGTPLGAGVVVSSPECPVVFSSRIIDYLAGQSAGRCGPCFNGLPAMAAALREIVSGHDQVARVEQLTGLVTRRGACAHPDGTARLATSLLTVFPHEIDAHLHGTCGSWQLEEAAS